MPQMPLVIMLEETGIRVDGLPVSNNALAQILSFIAHPDPRRWMKFDRVSDYAILHLMQEEPGPAMKCDSCAFTTSFLRYKHCPIDGTILTSNPAAEVANGRSSEGVGPHGEETENARNSSAPN